MRTRRGLCAAWPFISQRLILRDVHLRCAVFFTVYLFLILAWELVARACDEISLEHRLVQLRLLIDHEFRRVSASNGVI